MLRRLRPTKLYTDVPYASRHHVACKTYYYCADPLTASTIGGAGYGRGDDLQLDAVLKEARRILAPHIPLIDFRLVGAEARLQKVQRLLGLTAGTTRPGDVLVVGMHGMGGVGKTTLATKVRDEAPVLFGGRIVRLCVGHGCNPGTGLEAKRSKLLQLLSPGPQQQDSDQDEARSILKRVLSSGGPLLLILDDLWTRDQVLWLLGHEATEDVEAAVGNMAVGSRLLLTSRDH